MDAIQTDRVLQYSLLVAGQADPGDRELGPIHLIKYVYLADLAYSARHGGQTLTSAPWRFHHFGPWAAEVYERLVPAATGIGASARHFTAPGYDETIRWQCSDETQLERLERELPRDVCRAVRTAVHEFGADTTALLHYVYRTPPMLRAAPSEALDFTPDEQVVEREVVLHQPAVEATASKTSLKKREQAKDRLRERIAQRLMAKRAAYLVPDPPPRYDDVFDEGTQWLDGLEWETREAESGELTIDAEVWKSRGRRESGLS